MLFSGGGLPSLPPERSDNAPGDNNYRQLSHQMEVGTMTAFKGGNTPGSLNLDDAP